MASQVGQARDATIRENKLYFCVLSFNFPIYYRHRVRCFEFTTKSRSCTDVSLEQQLFSFKCHCSSMLRIMCLNRSNLQFILNSSIISTVLRVTSWDFSTHLGTPVVTLYTVSARSSSQTFCYIYIKCFYICALSQLQLNDELSPIACEIDGTSKTPEISRNVSTETCKTTILGTRE